MKKLLFAVSALAALSLLAPSSGLAQTYYNQIGIFADEAGTTPYVEGAAPFSNVNAYVVLLNPHNTDTDADILGVRGAEWQLVLPATALATSITFPTQAVNVGVAPNVIVGFSSPLSVSSGACVLATYVLLYMDATGSAAELLLSPSSPASQPGFMAFLDPNYLEIPAHPASGAWEDPVFAINAQIVATEQATMDGIKALYR